MLAFAMTVTALAVGQSPAQAAPATINQANAAPAPSRCWSSRRPPGSGMIPFPLVSPRSSSSASTTGSRLPRRRTPARSPTPTSRSTRR
ncbi:hypothetical protein ACFQZ4_49920 [Catellatospora coxensis]